MKALLVIDMQNDFMEGGSLPVPHASEIIPIINILMNQFDYVIASMDWHPPCHISFAKTHNKKPYETNDNLQILWPEHCIKNSWGAALVADLRKDKIDKIIYKGTNDAIDSYSAFFDNAKYHATDLNDYLTSLKIDELFITGVATEYCVKATVFDAIDIGFKVNVIMQACRGLNKTHIAFKEMAKKGAILHHTLA
jgi:nicotinamidase/pyrazinamidase